MNALTKTAHRVILGPGGDPESVLIPYSDYIATFGDLPLLIERGPDVPVASLEPNGIPHEVIEKCVDNETSLIKAWREHKALTQAEVAKRAGITQAALSKIETSHGRHREATLKKLAVALGVDIEQIRE